MLGIAEIWESSLLRLCDFRVALPCAVKSNVDKNLHAIRTRL